VVSQSLLEASCTTSHRCTPSPTSGMTQSTPYFTLPAALMRLVLEDLDRCVRFLGEGRGQADQRPVHDDSRIPRLRHPQVFEQVHPHRGFLRWSLHRCAHNHRRLLGRHRQWHRDSPGRHYHLPVLRDGLQGEGVGRPAFLKSCVSNVVRCDWHTAAISSRRTLCRQNCLGGRFGFYGVHSFLDAVRGHNL